MSRRIWGHDVMHYGHLSWIVPILASLATLFFLLPAYRCSLTVVKNAGTEAYRGYWRLETDEFLSLGPENDKNVCVKWGRGSGRSMFDGIWKVGKAIGVLGTLTTVPAAAVDWFLFFTRIDVRFFYPLIGVHIVNAFFSFMLLIGKRSDVCKFQECVLARAAYVAVVGGLFWLIVALLLVFVRREEERMKIAAEGVGWKGPDLLALPAPSESDTEREERPLALPAPTISPASRRGHAPGHSREIPLALPPSETAQSPKAKRTKKSSQSNISGSNRTNATTSLKPNKSPRKSERSKVSGDVESPSPRKSSGKSTRPLALDGVESPSPRKSPRKSSRSKASGEFESPRRSSTSKSPKTGSNGAKTPNSNVAKKKKKKTQQPVETPEI